MAAAPEGCRFAAAGFNNVRQENGPRNVIRQATVIMRHDEKATGVTLPDVAWPTAAKLSRRGPVIPDPRAARSRSLRFSCLTLRPIFTFSRAGLPLCGSVPLPDNVWKSFCPSPSEVELDGYHPSRNTLTNLHGRKCLNWFRLFVVDRVSARNIAAASTVIAMLKIKVECDPS